MEALTNLISLLVLLLGILAMAKGYRRLRGRKFGLLDLLLFGGLAVAADIACYQLFQMVKGPHSESSAWGALGGLILLLGAAPVALLLSSIAFMALLRCLFEYPALRWLALIAIVFAAFTWPVQHGKEHDPSSAGAPNVSKLDGEHWAMEFSPANRADCDRQSRSLAFREGCYEIVRKYPITPR